jgi:arginyl-tRNA synthetase
VYLEIVNRIRTAIASHIRLAYGVEVKVLTERPPRLEMGEVASPVCFELAKRLKKAPRVIAQEIVGSIGMIDGVARLEVAGGGYLNAFLDRGLFFVAALLAAGREERAIGADSAKTIVEHTAINPNKAAHIGHLRNAVLGDSFSRILRYSGERVEVQNYIDNTGVQVADVVWGFLYLEKKSIDDVRRLSEAEKFDYYCWDLYARVTEFLEEDKKRLDLRADVLKKMEEGHGIEAEMAELISVAIVRCHLRTMDRLGIDYDLLPRESEILHLKFWDAAFAMLKEREAIRLATSGKNAGCWVMPLTEAASGGEAAADASEDRDGEQDVKIIVRSTGTVTYVGKDIAFHLWKFGLLERDFYYRPFYKHPSGREAWITSGTSGDAHSSGNTPEFGHASSVYNVIDVRQAYPQQVVAAGLRAGGFDSQADHLKHLAYDRVVLTPRCAAELGYEIPAEDAKKQYVEISGRKGQGVKADDLIDKLMEATRREVDSRHPESSAVEREENARRIAVGALRYFLLKFTRGTIIAFDFEDALSFEGETGPYCLYAIVRARSIWRKEFERSGEAESAGAEISAETANRFLSSPDGDSIWDLILTAGSLGSQIETAIAVQEPAFLAKYAFQLAQAFNLFYHKHRILSEEDAAKKAFLLLVTSLVERQLVAALQLLGIEAPEEM